MNDRMYSHPQVQANLSHVAGALGYRVLGPEPVLLVYYVTQRYNPKEPDEQRIAFDDPSIGFDWTTQNR